MVQTAEIRVDTETSGAPSCALRRILRTEALLAIGLHFSRYAKSFRNISAELQTHQLNQLKNHSGASHPPP
jgi:hypothetical protein